MKLAEYYAIYGQYLVLFIAHTLSYEKYKPIVVANGNGRQAVKHYIIELIVQC